MKKTLAIVPFAAALVLTGCVTTGGVTPAQSSAYQACKHLDYSDGYSECYSRHLSYANERASRQADALGRLGAGIMSAQPGQNPWAEGMRALNGLPPSPSPQSYYPPPTTCSPGLPNIHGNVSYTCYSY